MATKKKPVRKVQSFEALTADGRTKARMIVGPDLPQDHPSRRRLGQFEAPTPHRPKDMEAHRAGFFAAPRPVVLPPKRPGSKSMEVFRQQQYVSIDGQVYDLLPALEVREGMTIRVPGYRAGLAYRKVTRVARAYLEVGLRVIIGFENMRRPQTMRPEMCLCVLQKPESYAVQSVHQMAARHFGVEML